MCTVSVFFAAALVASAIAKDCMNVTVPVSLESRNGVFDNIDTPYTALVRFWRD